MNQAKIDSAIRILRLAEKQANVYGEPVEIAYSGKGTWERNPWAFCYTFKLAK